MKLELSVSSKYVAHWGRWEGVRDIAQNVRDAVVMHGAKQEFKYQENKKTLILASRGASIDTSTLLMGNSTKTENPEAAGQYGEGMKLAYLALVRSGCRVRVRTADEVWEPKIEPSEKFAGQDVLVVYTRKVSHQDEVVTAIEGIELEEWALFKKRLLFLSPPKNSIETSHGTILLDPELKGKLFVHGIYVQDLPKVAYGYDLHNVKVDRDRNMASSFDVGYETSRALAEAMQRPEWTELRRSFYESRISSRLDGSNFSLAWAGEATKEILRDEFRRVHGEDAIPVGTEEMLKQLESFGVRAVVIRDMDLRNCLEGYQGSYLGKLEEIMRMPVVVHRRGDLPSDRAMNLVRAEQILLSAGYEVFAQVVEFHEAHTMGQFDKVTGAISIAYKALETSALALGTLIHEVARRECPLALQTEHFKKVEEIWQNVWTSHTETDNARSKEATPWIESRSDASVERA